MATMAWGMIHRDFHKQRGGQQLLEFCLDEITKDHPNHNISLGTSQYTFPFFEQFGFKVTQITPDGYAKGIDKYDMLLKK